MKILKKIMFLVIVTTTLTLSSCGNDDDSATVTPEPENFIKFKYNGTVYSFNPSTNTSLRRSIIAFDGINDSFKSISLNTPLEISLGQHPIVDDPQNLTTTYSANFTFMPMIEGIDATSGTLNITVLTNEIIEGTFNFSGAYNNLPVAITEGSFRAYR